MAGWSASIAIFSLAKNARPLLGNQCYPLCLNYAQGTGLLSILLFYPGISALQTLPRNLMSRRDFFIQIMMEAGGLPADSAFDYACNLFHDVDHNAGVDAPRSDHEAEEPIAMLRLRIPGTRTSADRDME
jgi:hypothetical protein